MKFKHIIIVVLVSVVSASGVIGAYEYFKEDDVIVKTITETQPIEFASLPYAAPTTSNQPVDFTGAASMTTPAVVHVTSSFVDNGGSYDPWTDIFGGGGGSGSKRSQASGSGVIISNDGFIVTNNHVIEQANNIEITLHNNKTYVAELVGRDADTDLALLKIEENDLESVRFADSDSVRIGEWVMAVGNPFNLASTVTAGIVSAKGRNINILEGNTAIESFIQTDAAVNPGNSGGALVNLNGELIGINTAIATPTGTFAGYSFAVPANLVKKVIIDLKDFGIVQRGFLGVNIRSVDDELATQLGVDDAEGVYLDNVIEGSAAEDAGLEREDIITHISGIKVKSAPALQEQVAKFRPGNTIEVRYLRNNKSYTTEVMLKNRYNETSMIDNEEFILNQLGINAEEVSSSDMQSLDIDGGVRITDVKNGKLYEYTDIKEGFVVTHIDDKQVDDMQEFIQELKNKNGKVTLEGVYPNKDNAYLYAFKM